MKPDEWATFLQELIRGRLFFQSVLRFGRTLQRFIKLVDPPEIRYIPNGITTLLRLPLQDETRRKGSFPTRGGKRRITPSKFLQIWKVSSVKWKLEKPRFIIKTPVPNLLHVFPRKEIQTCQDKVSWVSTRFLNSFCSTWTSALNVRSQT